MTTHNLPRQSTPFIGRTDDLAEIARLLADPACQLLTLVGPGGIGKTRLALQAAEQQASTFAQGVFFVSLAPLDSAESIVPTIAEAVGFSFYPGDDSAQQLLNYLGAKNLLLVLDNFEHLLAGAILVVDILRTAPGVKILVTSRERLQLEEEWVRHVDGMTFPKSNHIEHIEQYSAIQLFAQRAHRVRDDFSLANELASVILICQLVEGLPLGILLAASWVETLSLEEIADEINRSMDFLESEMRGLPARHRNIRAVFDSSWNRLAEVVSGTVI